MSFLLVSSAFAQPFTNTVTYLENQKPGTSAWLLTKPSPLKGIEGYASLTSVNRGGQIKFFVNTTNTFYTLEIFRMGWYDGLGARQMLGPVSVPGYPQVIPTPDAANGLVECNWTNPYVLNIPATPDDPTDWASGCYLVRLTGGQDGYQAYIIFAVRDDQRPTDLLVQFSYTTYAAYNEWGGTGLYNKATKVSFNRPFRSYPKGQSTYNPYWNGSGHYFSLDSGAPGWECNFVRWLEREGYDVSYCTSVDTHADTNLLSNHKAFISDGHDEYWSTAMQQNVKAARDRGVNVAFLSANVSYWQVRFEPSTNDGSPNRTVVCYKSTNDPAYASATNYLTTVQFRDNPVRNPESSFIGVQYGYNPINLDMVVNDPTHWAFTNTGIKPLHRFVGLLGYEVDVTTADSPTNIQVACHSPFLPPFTLMPPPFNSDMTSYTASSGATVFATGSMQWNWGLDDFNAPTLRQSLQSPVAQQVTRNVLARMVNQSAPNPTLFFRTDKATEGTWKPAYGADGYVLPGDSTNIPNYAVLDFGGIPVTNCLVTSSDTNSLQSSLSNARYLSAWSATDTFTVDVNLTDTQNHQVALYFWDWNNAGRKQLVEVLDAQSMNLLDSRTINNFTNGQWWAWQINGHVKIRISNLAGPDCLLGAVMFGSGTLAVSAGQDSTTLGNWPSFYGSDGAYIAGGLSNSAGYARLIYRNSAITNWSLDTTDARAPLSPGSSRRPLAAWVSQGNTINAVDIKVTDNAWHQLAVYCVDPDGIGRKQLITLVDPANNLVLDAQTVTNFSGGRYLVWNFRGNIQLRFQSLNQMSAVINGIFLGTPNQPPAIAINTPTNSQVFTLPVTINFTSSASDSDGVVSQVSYYTNGTMLATVTNAPFDFNWTNATVGQYSLTARAVDDQMGSTFSAPVSISVVTPAGYRAPVLKITSPPSSSTWQTSTNVPLSALITSNTAAIASLQFFVDGNPYGSLITNAPFSQSVPNLALGRHTASAMAVDVFGTVVSSASSSFRVIASPVSPPVVSLISPNNGARLFPPASLTLSAAAYSSMPGPCRVDFYANGNLIGSDSSGTPYSVNWGNLTEGAYQLTAVVVDASGATNVSSPVSLIVATAVVANFAGVDTNRHGNWRGTYGDSGFLVAGAQTNLPNFVSLASSAQIVSWANPTTDIRALQTGEGSNRVAAQLYSFTNVVLDLNLTDGLYHRVSLYFLDWLNLGVNLSVQVVDYYGGQILDQQPMWAFARGTYASWDVRGHVRFVILPSGGLPAMMSGLFVDASPYFDPIAITDPPTGAIFSSPASITVRADTLADPKISRVELYRNSTLISLATNGPPYTFGLTNLPPGASTLYVRAVGSSSSLTSPSISIQVLSHQLIQITSLAFQPDGTLKLALVGPTNSPIWIESTTDPSSDNSWTPVITNTPGQMNFVIPNPDNGSQRFYRAGILSSEQ